MLSFSIVLPTYNAEPYLEKLLDNFFSQKGNLKEIIIVDSSSNDSTVSTAKKFKTTVLTIPKVSFDHGGTRNFGATHASGDILMFITQDILPAGNDLLLSFENVFKDQSIGGGYARQIPRLGANPVESLTRQFSYPETSRINTYDKFIVHGVSSLYFANPCACVRRTVFQEVSGFPDRVICNEDMVIAYKILKAGYKTAYVSDAIVHHSHDYTPVQLFKRYFDIGVFFASYPELKSNAKNTNEGFAQTIQSIKSLLQQKMLGWIPKLLIETVSKLVGYKSGQQFKKIPNGLRIRLSMNRNFWLKLNRG